MKYSKFFFSHKASSFHLRDFVNAGEEDSG